jgi:hypothetical protein
MRNCRTVLIGMLVSAVVLATALPVLAATNNVHVRTSDPSPGGQAHFYTNGNRFKVCDVQADGHSAWAYVSYTKSFQNRLGDTNGAGNGCAVRHIKATNGRTVYVKVCLRNRDKESPGAPFLKHCSRWTSGTA